MSDQRFEQVTLTVPLWLWEAMSKAYFADRPLFKGEPVRQHVAPGHTEEELPNFPDPLYGLKDVEVVNQRGPAGWIPRGIAETKP